MAMGYGVAREAERGPLGEILHVAFGLNNLADRWFQSAGFENIRVLRSGKDGDVLGGLMVVPMGQWFGGRSVPMVGISGVGISPSARGRGAATELMRRTVRELHKGGTALSALYPATLPLYRRAGYETAGGCWRVTIPGRELPRTSRTLTSRPFEPRDERQVRAVYAAQAKYRPGWLDRGPYIWHRTRRELDGNPARGHVLCDGRRVDGYIFYRQLRTKMGFDLSISDMAARTPAAQHGLLTFLADHRSLAGEIRWFGGVDEPLLMALPEHHYTLGLHHHWMLRICHVENALRARGYPRELELSLDMVIRDDVVRRNAGRYRLNVSKGSVEVVRGGRAALELDVRTLATLYSGHRSADHLATSGLLRGGPKAIARAATLFSGTPPSLPDFF